MAAKGISLHIGLNSVNPDHYDNWNGQLFGCENDAEVYMKVAEQAGFSEINQLFTRHATSENLINHFKQAAEKLQAGDLFFISYSGHGGTLPDLNKDEKSGFDQTWCLYDRQFIDDEILSALKLLRAGVRVLLFSDSCHSGTVSKDVVKEMDELTLDLDGNKVTHKLVSRRLPREKASPVYNANKEIYAEVLKKPQVSPEEISCFVMLFAACQDNQTAQEWGDHGLFTGTFSQNFNESVSSYSQLFKTIKAEIPNIQTPNFFRYGNQSFDFTDQLPFSITGEAVKTSIVVEKNETAQAAKPESSIIVHYDDKAVPFSAESRMKSRDGGDTEDAETQTGTQIKSIDNLAEKGWDAAYKEYFNRKNSNQPVVFVEPNAESQLLRPLPKVVQHRDNGAAGSSNVYLANWPQPDHSPQEFIWHLDDEHSQLRKASDKVLETLGEDKAKVRIGHIDTGYLEHVSNPKNLLKDLGVSFVKNEFGINKGVDKLKSGAIAEQDGHGCATMAILAGNKVSKSESYSDYDGYYGAVPFAEVVPIRICETVFNFFNANDVADGIDYAVDNGCEVITMSMAGYPTKKVARAINRAYDNGVVVVTAAGNNWTKGMQKLTPKSVMYPARFARVISATGTCYNQEPYDLQANSWFRMKSEGGEFMQGNWGPQSAMKNAVAAYTPNLPWATTADLPSKFLRSGGGTSSATPQVAAAAALWIAYNKEKLQKHGIDKNWKKVEAARKAIFRSANKEYPEYKKYYGNGIIRAFDALESFDFENELGNLAPSENAKVSFGGLFPFIGQWFRGRPMADGSSGDLSADDTLKDMINLEIVQLLYRDPELLPYCDAIEFETEEGTDFLYDPSARKKFTQKLKQSPFISEFLKGALPAE